MSSLNSPLHRQVHTTIHFQNGNRVEVPPGDTIRVQDGWVSVTTTVHRPDHKLSQRGNGRVEQTTTWPASAIMQVETIREVA